MSQYLQSMKKLMLTNYLEYIFYALSNEEYSMISFYYKNFVIIFVIFLYGYWEASDPVGKVYLKSNLIIPRQLSYSIPNCISKIFIPKVNSIPVQERKLITKIENYEFDIDSLRWAYMDGKSKRRLFNSD